MKTLQTGTKVLIEATVIAEDYHDNNLSVRVELPNDMKIWIDPSDLTVCETAEVDKWQWQYTGTTDDDALLNVIYHDINREGIKIGDWIRYDGMVKKGQPFMWLPIIGRDEALARLKVEPQPIDLNNFAIDITNPVNAELLLGFEKWLRKTYWDQTYIYQGKYNGNWIGYISKPDKLTTLPVLQKQHPGVFNQSDSEPTPSFKAGQEVEILDSCVWVKAYYIGPTRAGSHVVEYKTLTMTILPDHIRPIPAQPTVESEILAVLEKCAGGQCGQKFTLTTESGLLQILDIFNRHQKHSGRVEVSVPSDEEIMRVYQMQYKNPALTNFEATKATLIHFMTRKEAK